MLPLFRKSPPQKRIDPHRAAEALRRAGEPLDGASYLLATIGVASVALAASALPARRAASVEPLTALRTE